MGYTGDPYSNCVDLDECAYPDLNTCAGGINVDADLFLDGAEETYQYYLGDLQSRGDDLVQVNKLNVLYYKINIFLWF